MKAKVIGVQNYEKNGNVSYTLHCISLFSDYDKQHGAIGDKVQTVWTNAVDCSNVFPGDLVELYFEPGFNNTATLSGFQILPKTSDNPFVVKDTSTQESATASPKGSK